MGADGTHSSDLLARWRAQGHECLDPVQFAFLEALQRRTREKNGALREVLEGRLEVLIAAYGARIAGASLNIAGVPVDTAVERGRLFSHAERGATSASEGYPELAALASFRTLWATVRTESQVRQTLAQEPSDGGPLNSSVLVHRAIGWMGEVSPGYLQHFLAYVDNLAWLDTLQQRGTLPSRDSAAQGAKPRRARAAR